MVLLSALAVLLLRPDECCVLLVCELLAPYLHEHPLLAAKQQANPQSSAL